MEVRDQVVPILLLLETGEHHLRARNVLLGVRQIDVESVRRPGDSWNRSNMVSLTKIHTKSNKSQEVMGNVISNYSITTDSRFNFECAYG